MKYVWAYSYTTISTGKLNTDLYWFDSSKNKYSIMNLDNSKQVTLDLDDKRPLSNNINDIIVSYINSSDYLCIRYQRDRFEREYRMMRVPPNSIINSVGFTKDYRFQLELKTPERYKHNTKDFIVGAI